MNPIESNHTPKIITEDGSEIEVSPRGSLALLAFGASGLDLWRKVRKINAEKLLKNKTENVRK